MLLLGTVNGEAVRIREKASTSSEVISLAVEGEKVNVIGKEGDWYKVEFENVTGYISSSYVDTEFNGEDTASENNETASNNSENNTPNNETQNPNSKPEETPAEPSNDSQAPQETPQASQENPSNVEGNNTTTTINETFEVGKNIKTSKEIKLRILPNFSSRENVSIASEKDITVLDELNNWVKVSDKTNSGWVRKSELSETKPASNEGTTTTNNGGETNTNNPEPEPKQPEEKSPDENSYEKKQATINVDRAVIRKSPNGEVVDGLDFGVEVEIIGEENDWYKINVKDYKEVYIAKRLLKIK